MKKPANLVMDPLVVGLAGAAFLLNTSEDKVRELLRAGLIREVPHLTSSARKAIAIAELQRFVQVGGDRVVMRRADMVMTPSQNEKLDQILSQAAGQ